MIKVYTYVSGDLPHIGHLRALYQAKALGDYLVVGVLTDEAIMAYKRKPVMPFAERLEMFASLKPVDEVVPQYDVDPTENLKRMPDVDVLVHGDDWGEDFPGAAYMRSVGKKAVLTKYYIGQSTSKIMAEIVKRVINDVVEKYLPAEDNPHLGKH